MKEKKRGYKVRHRYGKAGIWAILLCVVLTFAACSPSGSSGAEPEEGTSAAAVISQDGPDTEGQNEGNLSTDSQTADSQVVSMGRYVETAIALPGNTGSSARALQVLADGSWAYFESSGGYFISKDEGAAWQPRYSMQDLSSDLDADPYISCAAISSEGKLAFAVCDFSDIENMIVSIRIVDEAGNFQTVTGLLSEGDYVLDLEWKGEELYCVTLRGNICRIDSETGELKKLFTAAERPEMITFQGENMLLLENGGMEIFDLEANKAAASDEVLDEFIKDTFGGMLGTMSGCEVGLLVPDGEEAVYLACSDGLFRHVLGGTAMEQVIDGRFSSFGDSTLALCELFPYQEDEFLLFTTGAELLRLTYDPNEPSRPEKTLTVYSLHEIEQIRQGISVYQKQNPDVWVDYQIGMAEDSAVTLTDALKNLNMELTAGTGPDVLILDGIDEDIYIEKNALLDLSSLAETFTADNALIPNLLEASYTGEELYVIPAAFSVPALVGKTEDLEKISDMETLVQMVEALSGDAYQTVTGCFSAQQELAQLLSVYSSDFLNEGRLDKEELIQFLNYAVRIYQADQKNVSSEYREMFSRVDMSISLGNMVQYQSMDLGLLSYGLVQDMMYDLGMVEMIQKEGEYSMKLFDEENAGFVPSCKLAVSAASMQPELAEDFLRLILGYEMQKENYYAGYPINQAAFLHMCTDQDNEICFGGSWSLPDGREGEVSADYPPRELTQELENMVGRLTHSMEQNPFIQEEILETGAQVLIGSISAEEGADRIERNVAIYLAE